MESINVSQYLKILGYRVKDRVTQFEGVAIAVNFDLFGCVQVAASPGLDEKKDRISMLLESIWFDHKRLEVRSKAPVMEMPEFISPGKENGGSILPQAKPGL